MVTVLVVAEKDDVLPLCEAISDAGGLPVILNGHPPSEHHALVVGRCDTNLERRALSAMERALADGIPLLALGEGLHLLNGLLGGRAPDRPEDGPRQARRHTVWISPGSKLATAVGIGGFFRLHCTHGPGVAEWHRAPDLMTSAYAVDEMTVEAVEVPGTAWALGALFRPHVPGACPPMFRRLFRILVSQAERASLRDDTRKLAAER